MFHKYKTCWSAIPVTYPASFGCSNSSSLLSWQIPKVCRLLVDWPYNYSTLCVAGRSPPYCSQRLSYLTALSSPHTFLYSDIHSKWGSLYWGTPGLPGPETQADRKALKQNRKTVSRAVKFWPSLFLRCCTSSPLNHRHIPQSPLQSEPFYQTVLIPWQPVSISPCLEPFMDRPNSPNLIWIVLRGCPCSGNPFFLSQRTCKTPVTRHPLSF